jgi:hypothetical protein
MALTSVFYDGVVTETDRAKNWAGSPSYGVYGIGDFEVTSHPSIPYAVLVKSGRAHGWGVTDEAAIDQVVNCDSISTGTRWDLIVVRRNWQPALGGPSTLVAIAAGTTPIIPPARKVGPGVEDDQPLALVKWQGGLSAPAQIIDLRVWAGNGGMCAKDDLVRSYLTDVGTEVNINGVSWALQIGANSIAEWAATTPVISSPLSTADTNWTHNGQVTKVAAPKGKATVTLADAIWRAGLGFPFSTNVIPMIPGFVPAGFRPATTFSGWDLITDGADTPAAAMWFQITPSGDLRGRLDSGATTFANNWRVHLSGSWVAV